jgi:sec-independent protein translocase protein TatB
MIDLGLTKIALIGVVALVVIGPEKLPRVARMAGTLYGRAQRYILQVKTEVSREIELDELRKMHKDVQDAASDVSQSISTSMNEVESSMQSALSDTPTPDQLAVKVKLFRKKKLARNSALPSWYKHQHGRKSHVISGAARVARYRSTGTSGNGFFP